MRKPQPRDVSPKRWGIAATITAIAFLLAGTSPAAPFLYAVFAAQLLVSVAAVDRRHAKIEAAALMRAQQAAGRVDLTDPSLSW